MQLLFLAYLTTCLNDTAQGMQPGRSGKRLPPLDETYFLAPWQKSGPSRPVTGKRTGYPSRLPSRSNPLVPREYSKRADNKLIRSLQHLLFADLKVEDIIVNQVLINLSVNNCFEITIHVTNKRSSDVRKLYIETDKIIERFLNELNKLNESDSQYSSQFEIYKTIYA